MSSSHIEIDPLAIFQKSVAGVMFLHDLNLINVTTINLTSNWIVCNRPVWSAKVVTANQSNINKCYLLLTISLIVSNMITYIFTDVEHCMVWTKSMTEQMRIIWQHRTNHFLCLNKRVPYTTKPRIWLPIVVESRNYIYL